MNKFLSAILTICIVLTFFCLPQLAIKTDAQNQSASSLQDIKNNYELIFDDEFDGDKVDLTKWQYDGHLCTRNGEAQVYADDDKDHNIWVENGHLVIEGRKEDRTVVTKNGTEKTYHYTSGELSTSSTFAMKYGIIEARIQIPSDLSCWPAWWSCGLDTSTGGKTNWPKSGEIDIMENFAKSNSNTTSTLHYQPVGYTGTAKTTTGLGGYSSSTMSTQFHTYGLYWTPTFMLCYVDDYIIGTVDITDRNKFFAFHDYEQFFILNVAIGGAGGVNIADDFVSSQMLVDYVRAYQPADGNYSLDTRINTKSCSFNAGNSGASLSTKGIYVPQNSLGKDRFFCFNLNDIKQGTYNVYYQTCSGANTSYYQTQFNGVKLSQPIQYNDFENRGQHFIAKVKLQTDTDINVCVMATQAGSTAMTIEKVIFVKTDDQTDAVAVPFAEMDNSEPKTVEISSYSDWLDKIGSVFENDTIKLTGDVVYTPAAGYTFFSTSVNNVTIDLNGYSINDGSYDILKSAKTVNDLDFSAITKNRIIRVTAGKKLTITDFSKEKTGTLCCYSNLVQSDTGGAITVGSSTGDNATFDCSNVTLINVQRDPNGDRDAVVRLLGANSTFNNCNFYTTYAYTFAGNCADSGIIAMQSANETTNTFNDCSFVTNTTPVSIRGNNKNFSFENCRFNSYKDSAVNVFASDSVVEIKNSSCQTDASGSGISVSGTGTKVSVLNTVDSISEGKNTFSTGITATKYGIDAKNGIVNAQNVNISAGQYGLRADTNGIINYNGGNVLLTNKSTDAASKLYAPIGAISTGCVNILDGTFGAAQNANNQAAVYINSATAFVTIGGGSFTANTQLAISSTASAITNPVTNKSAYKFDFGDNLKIAPAKSVFCDKELENEITENLCYYSTAYVSKNINALYGDANDDKTIDVKDVLILRKYLTKCEVDIVLILADSNFDGKITVSDLLYIRKIIAN